MKALMPPSWIVLQKLRELRRNARLTRAELDARQLKKFRRLATYAARRSPYYAAIVREQNIDIALCRPEDFPVMDKAILMEHFDRIVTDPAITRQRLAAFLAGSTDPKDLFLDRYQVVQTSGSSGTAGYSVFSRDEWLRALTQGLRLRPLRRLFAARKYAFYGAASGHYAAVSGVSAGIHRSGRHGNDIRLFEINAPLAATVAALNNFQPAGLGGYTTSLLMLAEEQREGRLRLAPQWIEAMGEAITATDCDHLRAIFGCGVYNLYGCSEHSLMGIGLPSQSALTLYDDDLIYEFHDDHIIATNLLNFTMPLIRYRTDDILRPLPAASGPYRRIETLIGRAEMNAVFRNREGARDFLNLPMLIYTAPNLRRFQIRPIDDSSFHFLVMPEAPLNPRTRAAVTGEVTGWLRDILAHKKMDNVRFDIIIVDDIPVDPKTRKFRAVLPVNQTAAPPPGERALSA